MGAPSVAQGSRDQLGGELGQFLLSESPLLALEGDEPRDPRRLVDQPGARSVRHEELLDERRGHARRELGRRRLLVPCRSPGRHGDGSIDPVSLAGGVDGAGLVEEQVDPVFLASDEDRVLATDEGEADTEFGEEADHVGDDRVLEFVLGVVLVETEEVEAVRIPRQLLEYRRNPPGRSPRNCWRRSPV